MKRLFLIFGILLLSMGISHAGNISLTSAHTIQTPTAADIWFEPEYDVREGSETTRIHFYYKDTNGGHLFVPNDHLPRMVRRSEKGGEWLVWECKNFYAGSNGECTDVDAPRDCCTAAGEGTCPELVTADECTGDETPYESCRDVDAGNVQCFDNTYLKEVAAGHVGLTFKEGIRELYWSRMRHDVLGSGNNGTFD